MHANKTKNRKRAIALFIELNNKENKIKNRRGHPLWHKLQPNSIHLTHASPVACTTSCHSTNKMHYTCRFTTRVSYEAF